MSIWFRGTKPATEKRNVVLDGFSLTDIVGRSASAANIDGSVIGTAHQSVAVDTAVDLIASICSELPIDFYSGEGPNRRTIKRPAYLDDPAGDGYGLQDWIYQGMYSWLYRGNLYGDILARSRAGNGFITQMSLFHPDQVSGQVIDGKTVWRTNEKEIPDGRMYHRRAAPVPGQVLGMSPISKHADTIGITLAATRFGKSWFDSDAAPVGILRNSLSGIDPNQSRTIKDRFMAAMRGNREPIVMGRGWEWQNISITPEESQFLGTMGYSEAQCARIFGPGIPQLLGYETGGSLTYANMQDFDLFALKYSLNKWLRRFERILFDFLPRPQWCEFNRDALLQTTTMQRYQAHAVALGGAAWKEINEVREIENLQPLEEEEPEPAPPAEDEPAPAPDEEEESE